MRSKLKRKLNLKCAQNFIYYFFLKRETKNLALYIIFPISDLFYNITSPFIFFHVHASLCIIIIKQRVLVVFQFPHLQVARKGVTTINLN
jgi:hypothetical protein